MLKRARDHVPGLVATVSVLVIGASVAITISVGPTRPGLYVETTEEPAVIAQAFGIPVGTGEPLPYRPSSQGPYNWPGAPPPPDLRLPPPPTPATPEPSPPPQIASLRASLPALPPPRVMPLPRALPPLRVSPLPGETSDEPAWIANAQPTAPPDGRPEIAVIIDDAGVDRVHTGVAIRLKGPLTISFLPYASDVASQMRAAKANRHEVMLHVPMEPHGPFAEPEPYLLRARLGNAEIQRRLARYIDAMPGIVGINNHMGSLFTSDPHALAPVMEELVHRGLLFVDSRTSARSLAQESAQAHGLPNAGRDVFLDHYEGQAEVRKRLLETERVARKQGYAIAIGHPRVATLAELAIWLDEVESKGYRLVPVSAIVRARATQFAGRTPHGG
ncbi:MAG: divergent polysaccharide deacetylase family protein [Alphaproteobacteria bacterium]|nr:divergent polysaccharide deacetylase family protein [Alphaproteobacteria bacterium]